MTAIGNPIIVLTRSEFDVLVNVVDQTNASTVEKAWCLSGSTFASHLCG